MPMGGHRGPGPGGHGGFRHGHRGPGGFRHGPGRFGPGPRGFFLPPRGFFGPPPPRRFRRPVGCLGCGGFLFVILAAVAGIIAAMILLF